MVHRMSKPLLILVLCGVGVLVLGGAGAYAWYAGFLGQSMILGENINLLGANYVLKFGFTKPLCSIIDSYESEYDNTGYNDREGRDMIYIRAANDIISNIYGFAIADSPLKLDASYRKQLIKNMESMNKEAKKTCDMMDKLSRKEKRECQKVMGQQIFSQKLRATLSKQIISYNDFVSAMIELDKSANAYCNAVSYFYSYVTTKDQEDYSSNEGVQMILQLCEKKPKVMFQKVNVNKYVLSLPDLSIYSFGTWVQTNCEPQTVKYDDGSSYTYTLCGIDYQKYPEKKLLGTVQLSKLNFEVTNKGGDIAIALNQKGIDEVAKIKAQSDFSNYASQIEHKDSLDFKSEQACYSAGYFVISNSQAMVNKANGIEIANNPQRAVRQVVVQ